MSARAFAGQVIFMLFVISSITYGQTQWALDTVVSVGPNPTGIAITPDGAKIVVTNAADPGSVTILSTTDYSTQTIDISSIENYPNGVAVTPDDSTALVCTTHDIVFIDLNKYSVKGSIAAPCAATTLYGIAVLPGGANALLPDLGSGCTQQGLRMIDATGKTSGSTFIPVNTCGELYGVALTPDGSSAVLTTFTSDSPKKINLSTASVENIAGINGSYGVATFHKSNEALIFDGDSLDLVSLTSNSLIKKIAPLTYNTTFQNIAITADDKFAFAVGSFDKQVISLVADTVLETFTAGGTNVACAPNGSAFYVTDSYNGTVRVYKETGATAIMGTEGRLPSGYSLLQSYPNPFNPTTTIGYRLSAKSYVTLKVYDVLGREVSAVVNEVKDPGRYSVTFDGTGYASGVYFCRMVASPVHARGATDKHNYVSTIKLVLMK